MGKAADIWKDRYWVLQRTYWTTRSTHVVLPGGTLDDDLTTILYANQFYYDIYGYTLQDAEKSFTNARFIHRKRIFR